MVDLKNFLNDKQQPAGYYWVTLSDGTKEIAYYHQIGQFHKFVKVIKVGSVLKSVDTIQKKVNQNLSIVSVEPIKYFETSTSEASNETETQLGTEAQKSETDVVVEWGFLHPQNVEVKVGRKKGTVLNAYEKNGAVYYVIEFNSSVEIVLEEDIKIIE